MGNKKGKSGHKSHGRKAGRGKIAKRIILSLVTIAVLAAAGYGGERLHYYYDHEYRAVVDIGKQKEYTIGYNEALPEIKATATAWGKVWDRNGIEIPVICEGSVDATKVGDYEVVCSASYKDTESSDSYLVHVVDEVAPEIALVGEEYSVIENGSEYVEAGVIASDEYDGDLTDKVEVVGQVDTKTDGYYDLTYRVADQAGNTAEVMRTVRVYSVPSYKTVYLTFDDGPGPLTESLLDLLDKYQVKATFFVTGNDKDHLHLIGEEAKRGHTVAIHSKTHDYASVYKNEESYFDDLKAMEEIIYEQTGVHPDIVRFPGGSSNSVCYINSGDATLMDRLMKRLGEEGYRYCDWNVSTGDGGNTVTTEDVYNYATTGMASFPVAYILQHDTKKMSMDAVEDIIKYGIQNGYTFLPMDETTVMCHHREPR